MQDFGQWLPQSQNTADLYFSSMVSSQLDTSIETQVRNSAVALLEKESTHSFDIRDGAGHIEVIRNDAGAIKETENGAGLTDGIDLNKTPPPKTKRKKHRPKVLKPSKTPKSATPKPSKEKEERPSGKRKYVRKNTPAGQPPPEQAANSHCSAKLKPAMRCLNFNGAVPQENPHPGSQAQVVSTNLKDYQPSISSTSQGNVQSQLACHLGYTPTSSIYSSANQMADVHLLPADNNNMTEALYSSAKQMANAQLLPADNMLKGVSLDLNSSTNQIQNEYANFVDRPTEFFQSGIMETLRTGSLLELCSGMPDKNLPDLNRSIGLMQGMSTDCTDYFLSSSQASVKETKMARQMLNCHRVPENPITHAQCSEGVAMRENSNSNVCSREAGVNNPMFYGYRSTQNPISPPVMENLNELATINDYVKFTASSYRPTGGAFGLHGPRDSALDNRGEHNASGGAHISLGVKFDHQRNGRASVGASHAATSQGSYFPATYKRMRMDNQSNCLNVDVANFSAPSGYLSNNRNTNVVSAINSNVFTLADAQRLIAREKLRASQGIIRFGASGNDMVKRPEMVRQDHRPAMHGTTYMDSAEASGRHFRFGTEEFTQLPSNPNSLQSQNYIPRIESHQLQPLEGNTVKGSDLPAELHKQSTSLQKDTRNIVCVDPSDELGRRVNGERSRFSVPPTTQSTSNDTAKKNSPQLSGEVIRPLISPMNPSPCTDVLSTESYQVEVCGETTAAKPSEKRKVGRPRKEIKPGVKPKPRGRPRKEKLLGTELKSSHTDPLQIGDISFVSGPHVRESLAPKGVNTERSGESFLRNIESLADPLDLIIQKIKVLDINKSDDTGAVELHSALVPYKGEVGAVVPYEGKVKRKRARAKVSLDPVTALMWKLLMEPDMVDGSEEMDKDKEKWLDEERKIFQGRVDSFIARMHLVQGDRRFSPWKGSVVDSVVGVFLTQNVSDHLSSSAFMALAAKFPAKSEVSKIPSDRMFHTPSEKNGGCSGLFGDSVKLQGNILVEEVSNTTGSLVTTEEKEGSNSIGLFGNSPGGGVDCAAGVYYNSCGMLPVRLPESKPPSVGTGSFVEVDDGALEDVVSSQNSTISSQSSPDYLLHVTDPMFPSRLLNFTVEDFVGRNMAHGTSNSTTYTELLKMQELKSKPNENSGLLKYGAQIQVTNKRSVLNEVRNPSLKHQPLHSSVSYHQNGQAHLPDITYANDLEHSVYPGINRIDDSSGTVAPARFDCPLPSPGTDSENKTKMTDSLTALLYCIDESLSHNKISFPYGTTPGADLSSPMIDKYFQPASADTVSFTREQSYEKNLSRNGIEAALVEQHDTLNLQEECTTRANQIGGDNHQSVCSQQYGNVGLPTNKDESRYSSNLCQNEKANSEPLQGVALDSIEKLKDIRKSFPEVPADGSSKAKKARVGTGKKRAYDWDILRKEVLVNHGNEERANNAKDALDWETIRQIDVKEISDTIRERGMNNMLAERIKAFLNRLVTDHGSIDLEWLRYVDPDKAKEYLLSIRGLGLKSVECVRLLTLHHMAFPVDTNVGRICVRLGWVPLQPLPESLQLHLLELYPMLENIQKYLWPRLCKLDQRTLYELHYQMITFGKVFCTKSKPNCNACPMRAECKHFASAFASARLALPGPEEKSLVTSGNPIVAESCQQPYISSRPLNQLDWNAHPHDHVLGNRQPIIEEPASPEPEPETAELKEGAIEDMFFDDPEEIPTIKLNFEEFAQNLKNYMQVNNIDIEDADMSSALVAITPEAASIPTPRLKNVSRLRTEHQVYELPDSHPLLEGFDQREPDDPCPYLLSIWTPGETAQSADAPMTSCNSHESGKLCDSSACFSCNSIREVQAQKVRGTLLIPCRTAMRGSFPLNGTYFQVNEVFADHDSSRNPIDVPRSWIWNLPRRTVYFGTSVPTIFKGLTTEDIQHCFWRGFVCVRGFDRISRAPRPLYARLHFPASKITRNKKPTASAARDDA
ncbi:uncharacterized protein LOC100841571 isoform X1 [Brachypodium distachyon]|uniref:HhH-GPD domain-containing protein n=1 Tax=Brachypodium distachyon TaxID=15368 RepID=I1IIY5_BRADI|nr:uncharacterized protein LOC100841571 isoform X1 [Brachypodium distachyon]XP_014758215.1 uncharacterized protein LOC100841571 isoform X1 [Brachypodium distachyon]KQJ86995.1 hypothetical protein BRADI_4g08870v3 [Brachypodium distachyon]PNT62848.1 hypothetical protein BRADI_4g08870v3 [Brachypodium distachyon]|eukprot:XP_003577140.1 uncharacterized protein LOC100841571 isoform X1 [Brachypodium distachyon]